MTKNSLFAPFNIPCGSRSLAVERPIVMGILNITPDSFYDGGSYTAEESILRRANQIIEEGGKIIDIGAVSTRPGAQLLSPEGEAEKLVPAVRAVRRALPDALISVDTCYALPARKAVEAGADIINDISGGQFDPLMFQTTAELQVPYILCHTCGTPDIMQQNTHYDNILQDITNYFHEKLEALYRSGVRSVILDPCFGFAKTFEQNYEILNRLDLLTSEFKEPWMVGVSRKSMIYKAIGGTPMDALHGTTALHAKAVMKGAAILRAHDVRAAADCITVTTL